MGAMKEPVGAVVVEGSLLAVRVIVTVVVVVIASRS